MTDLRRPVPARTRGVALSVVAAAALAGCSPSTVEIRATDPAERTACAELVANLPDEVADQARRSVSPADAPGGAWGDPPIVLTCGVPPIEDPLTCQEADGVFWYVPEDQIEDESADVVLTTVGYQPTVEVRVPATYRPPVGVFVDLAPALRRHLDLVEPCT